MFISSWNQRTCSGTCPKCGGRTCRLCGGRAHMFGGLGVLGGRPGGKKVRVRVKTRNRNRNGKRGWRGVGMCPVGRVVDVEEMVDTCDDGNG
ncbi:hypothetical protein QBC44DRAFT_337937 [Cladorrhinum sp. PSN332]|nr:hypothetical protein QBC44DRAFT_337937 [Cladorrhinum sp. PSN332]